MASFMDKAKNYVADKITDMPKPEASINDVDFAGLSGEGVSYLAKVGVTNPYPHSIPICEIKYVFKSDTRTIVTGKVLDPGSLKSKDTTVLDVPMMVPHNIIVSLVKDLWRDWDLDYELEIGLVIDLPVIGDFTIPLSTKGEVKLPTIGDLWSGGKDEEKKEEVNKA